MKKILAVALSLCIVFTMCLGLTGCSAKPEKNEAEYITIIVGDHTVYLDIGEDYSDCNKIEYQILDNGFVDIWAYRNSNKTDVFHTNAPLVIQDK